MRDGRSSLGRQDIYILIRINTHPPLPLAVVTTYQPISTLIYSIGPCVVNRRSYPINLGKPRRTTLYSTTINLFHSLPGLVGLQRIRLGGLGGEPPLLLQCMQSGESSLPSADNHTVRCRTTRGPIRWWEMRPEKCLGAHIQLVSSYRPLYIQISSTRLELYY
jgi:hypothetical protein